MPDRAKPPLVVRDYEGDAAMVSVADCPTAEDAKAYLIAEGSEWVRIEGEPMLLKGRKLDEDNEDDASLIDEYGCVELWDEDPEGEPFWLAILSPSSPYMPPESSGAPR